MSSMHVAIDARLPDSGQGGVQQVLRQLGLSFAEPHGPQFSRTWIVYQGTTWWKDSLPSSDDVIEVSPPFGGIALRIANRLPTLISFAYPILRRVQRDTEPYDEELSKRGVDVVHLPFQDGFLTSLPSVYNPHDLQHHYFPENFSKMQILHRENIWRRRADRARLVMAASQSVAADLENYWHTPSSKIRVIPIPPPDRTLPELDPPFCSELTRPYVIYPAIFWPHKNHARLIKAIEKLQNRGQFFDLVLTGARAGNFGEVAKLVDKLPDPNRVKFMGHVSNSELSWLIHNAQLMVVPSLFEAMSLTVWDAQRVGTPVACSSVPPFPDQVGDSAITFDPFDADDIARVLALLATDESMRERLARVAKQRVEPLTPYNYAWSMFGVYCEANGVEAPIQATKSAELLLQVISS